ncbi:MAG: RDD family protein [Cytophagaceae bacterium]
MKEIPLQLDGIDDNIYAGFPPRFSSLVLDMAFLIPLSYGAIYINSLDRLMFFYTIIPLLLIKFVYNVYIPHRYGATSGKLVLGLQFLRIDGQEIGFKEAFLRYSVLFALSIFGAIVTTTALVQADDTNFNNLDWVEQATYLMSFSPILYVIADWAGHVWTWSEVVVLLTNPLRRALHDYIAGTVIVKKKHVKQIQEVINN